MLYDTTVHNSAGGPNCVVHFSLVTFARTIKLISSFLKKLNMHKRIREYSVWCTYVCRVGLTQSMSISVKKDPF